MIPVYNIGTISGPELKMLLNSSISSSNFADSLKTIYLNRISNAVKRLTSCCRLNNYSLNRVEFAFLTAFVICEIEIYNHAKLDPQGFHYTFSKEWTEYIENLQFLRIPAFLLKHEARSLQPILEELRISLVYFPKEQWSDFLSQDSIIEYFLKVFSVLVHESMADACPVPLTVFTDFPKEFSWGDTKIKKNPWLTIYKDICCSNSSGDIMAEYIYETENMIRVQPILSQDNQKKIMLYAQSKELLLKEIQTIKTWTQKVDPSKVYPETLIIQEQQSIRTPLQVLLHNYVQKQSCTSYLESWYSVNASPILPRRVLSIYGGNPYNSNCHGAALYTLGITTIPRYFALPFENPYFDKIMEPVMNGYLESGDMIHLISKDTSIGGMHSLVYISPNLVIQMRGFSSPYEMCSLRDVFLHYNKDIRCFKEPFKNDFKTDIDYEHTSIIEILKQSLKIYRKRKDAPCLYNQSIINVTQTINELFVNYPDLNCFNYKNKTEFKSDAKYQELQTASTRLLIEAEHNTAVRKDIDAINEIMPNLISNQINSRLSFFSSKKQKSENYCGLTTGFLNQ